MIQRLDNRIVFTGFDSAWGGRASGAITDLVGTYEDGKLVLSLLKPPRQANWEQTVQAFKNDYEDCDLHVIAIDQGLVVANACGMRDVEKKFAIALMRGFKCGAHASNLGNRSCYGNEAGIWRLLNVLSSKNYRQSPSMIAQKPKEGKFYFECYPHPAIIGLFDLTRTLQYKVNKRNKADWQTLLQKIGALPIRGVEAFVTADLKQTKENEDKLDSIVCAYVSAYLWQYGFEKSMCIGLLTTGYMVTPVSPSTSDAFRRAFDESEINCLGEVCDVTPPFVLNSIAKDAEGPDKNRLPLKNNEHSKPIITDSNVGANWKPALLNVSDTGNLQFNANRNWMVLEKCEGYLLHIRVLQDSEPTLCFRPYERDGINQRGMKPYDEATKTEWKLIAEGASKSNVLQYNIEYRYTKLE